MFIKSIKIENYRIFPKGTLFETDRINVPDGVSEGSGITLLVGENGCGKTTLLEALALPLLTYKADNFRIDDFNDPHNDTRIEIQSNTIFNFDGVMPNTSYKAKGFSFDAGIRKLSNAKYLSSIVVSDQRFIRADGEVKPKDGAVDLRFNVTNPFKGPRFNDTDILYLDQNRTHQIKSGTYNSTRFDKIMEDFDYQYIKKRTIETNLNNYLVTETSKFVENQFLNKAIEKFKETTGYTLDLRLMSDWRPHNNAFFNVESTNNQIIELSRLGSGYEMFFSLLYSLYLAKQNNKKQIILIDEPELHLHPKLQESFVEVLLEASKNIQIVMTTQSPLFVKYFASNDNVLINTLTKESGSIEIKEGIKNVLPYISANEINYIAFKLPTEEYYNELYEELLHIKGVKLDLQGNQTVMGLQEFDDFFFYNFKKHTKDFPWKGNPNSVTIFTFLRNQIHHQKDNGKPKKGDLESCISDIRTYLEECV